MGNSLEKKLRNIVLEKQRRNFRLKNKKTYELVLELSLGEIRKLEQDLMRDEFYEFKCIFEELEDLEILLSIIPNDSWFRRCCLDFRLFGSFSDKQLEKILNDNCLSISELFFAIGINRNRQYRVIKLLYVDILDNWIHKLTIEQFSEFNHVLIWLHDKVKEAEHVYMQNEETEMFRKFASISDVAICYLLENTESFAVKEIVKQLNQMGRNVWEIYKVIATEHLYDVLVKSDFAFLDNVSEKEYSWLYFNLPAEDVERFLLYLASKKRNELELFNSKICCGIYGFLSMEHKEEFVNDLLAEGNLEKFENFYEFISLESKEEIFEFLLKTDNGKVRIKLLFQKKEKTGKLSLFETLIKKYVTQK